jgi:hypothetical protein
MPFLCISLRCFALKVSPTVENDRGYGQHGADEPRTEESTAGLRGLPHQ